MRVKFDLIGLFVKDLNRMVRFYNEIVGIDIQWDGQGPYAEFKHDGIRFAMYERSELSGLLGQEPSYPAGINGTFELALNVGDPANVDTAFARLIAAEATEVYAPRNEPWKMRSAMIADPEGNLIEIASDFWE